MNVPPDRIRLLLEHDASREEIIKAIKQLSVEKKIQVDDPILIYYAGHGSQLTVPPGWEAGGPGRKIQGICPWDCEKGGISAIPDRTLGAFLDLISKNKGNNITVIFDCCHSASGTRVDVPSTDIRGVVLDDELDFNLDLPELPIPVGRNTQIPTRFGVRGLGSHVLVAACKETETAKEEDGRGRFTLALLELLNKEGRLEKLTYSDILKELNPIRNQNPQVEGVHRDRIIFNAKATRHQPFFTVRLNYGEGTYTLDAGSARGIVKGSQFTIYKDQDSFLKSSPWGVLLVEKVVSSTSILRRTEGATKADLENTGIAILSAGGADQVLAIKASYEPTELRPVFLEAIRRMENQRMISLVDENAEIEMQLESGHLRFNILLPAVNACGLYRVYYTAKPTDTADAVARILSAGSCFFWHLRRSHYHPIVDSIKIEFLELTADEDEFDEAGYPVIIASEENLLRDGVIDLYVGSEPKRYGIKITNDSPWDLFPAAFYFDHSNWSIETYYHPGTAGKFEADVPLPKNGGTLTIGYGSGGADSISFLLNADDQNLDVGHLKIFFTTKPADLRGVGQESPFTGAQRGTYRVPPLVLDSWVTVQYPIIQRRAP